MTNDESNDIKGLIKDLRNEISFARSEFESVTENLHKEIGESQLVLKSEIENLSNQIKAQSLVANTLEKEISKLILVPEKIKTRITNITPELALEVDKIYEERTKALENGFNNSSIKLYQVLKEQREESQNLIIKLIEDIEIISSKNKMKIFKILLGLVFTICFISGFTSYCVTHYFPTHVSIKGVSSLEVRDSQVHVSGGTIRKENAK